MKGGHGKDEWKASEIDVILRDVEFVTIQGTLVYVRVFPEGGQEEVGKIHEHFLTCYAEKDDKIRSPFTGFGKDFIEVRLSKPDMFTIWNTKNEYDSIQFACQAPKGEYLTETETKEAVTQQKEAFVHIITKNPLENEKWGATLRIAGSTVTTDFSVCVLTVTDFFKMPVPSEDCGDSPVPVENRSFTC